MYPQSIKGSITIFMSMMLMLVASLLFTLLEGSRYLMLGMEAVLNSQSVTQSMFAEYHVPAYDNYHLFLLDSGYGTGELRLSELHARMQQLAQENLNPTVKGWGRYSHFLQMDAAQASVVQYQLATDQHAGALLEQMTQVMKKELATDFIDQTVKKLTGVQESSEQGKKADHYLDGALDAIEQAKEAEQQDALAAERLSKMRSLKLNSVSNTRILQTDTADGIQGEWTA